MTRSSLEERRKRHKSRASKRTEKEEARSLPGKSQNMILAALVIALAVMAVVAFTLVPEDEDGLKLEIDWVDDYEKGMDNASESGRPALVYFHTDWCTFCDQMENDTFSKERIVLLSRDFTAIYVDGDERQDLVDRYDVDGYPTVVFVDAEENELHRAVGYRDADEFHGDMKTALDNY